jgi:hypothetical protein
MHVIADRVTAPCLVPSNGSWFLVPVVYFLLSVSLFSARPKLPPTGHHDHEGHHTMDHPVAWTGHLFKYLAIPWPTSSTTYLCPKLALSRPRTSQPDRYSSEGRPFATQHSELCVHLTILSRPSCPPKESATGNCLLRSRT